jgi:hypothetical protein
VGGNPAARQAWAVGQMRLGARASRNLDLTAHVTFSGAWPFVYPWPQRPAGLIETAFDELARRWTPILDAFVEARVDLCYEIHPGEDLHDGVTYEMFLERVGNHSRCNILYDPSHFLLQQLDYLEFIDEPPQLIRRAGPAATAVASHASRVPSGHPEGYFEAFAQIYRGVAEQVGARLENRPPDPASLLVPGIADGVRGMRFIAASVASSQANAGWTDIEAWLRLGNVGTSGVKAVLTRPRRRVAGAGDAAPHGPLLLGATDQVLRPAILWNDRRDGAECRDEMPSARSC